MSISATLSPSQTLFPPPSSGEAIIALNLLNGTATLAAQLNTCNSLATGIASVLTIAGEAVTCVNVVGVGAAGLRRLQVHAPIQSVEFFFSVSLSDATVIAAFHLSTTSVTNTVLLIHNQLNTAIATCSPLNATGICDTISQWIAHTNGAGSTATTASVLSVTAAAPVVSTPGPPTAIIAGSVIGGTVLIVMCVLLYRSDRFVLNYSWLFRRCCCNGRVIRAALSFTRKRCSIWVEE